MGPYLPTDLVVRQRLLELIEAGHKYMLHVLTKDGPLLITEQNHEIIVHTVILAKIEVESMSENLRSSVWKEVLWHKDDQRMFLLSAASEILVSFSVGRQKNLAE